MSHHFAQMCARSFFLVQAAHCSKSGRQGSGWKRRRSPVVIILGCSNSTIFHSEYLTFLHKHTTHTYEHHRNKVCSSPASVLVSLHLHNMHTRIVSGAQEGRGRGRGNNTKEGSYF